MGLITIIMIAISLSMDAFSLSLAYGTLNLEKKNMRELATIVGVYHFFMPLLGLGVGTALLFFLPINPDIVVFCVLSFIGVEMVIETFKKEETMSKMGLGGLLLFGFAVSVDSFSVGVGLKSITTHFIIGPFLFSLSSFLFTYLGLFLGKKISAMVGKLATLFGGLTLVLIGILYLF